jgi:hypothetical protein
VMAMVSTIFLDTHKTGASPTTTISITSHMPTFFILLHS